ncbi:competence type IV pilus ATPase ComGA [Tuberibacillus sp. Marseille-P3662]|uniref:competence type IV pilus ATPase ComGA n=1 Tax=Tuberibacillus sp. Marseille-P3662 TaxID=1965358 RepID=UPI000A1CABE4|nr:competence type IV pilus ATPase ComGA [Tuberibacillus sp. Marseille-P3662]
MYDIEDKSREILAAAVELKATDIHFVPRKKDTLIELRVDDHLYEMENIPSHEARRVISHFKFVSGMDIGDRRKPQDGAYDTVIKKQPVHLRLSTLPATYNESLVIRILPQVMDERINDLSVFSECTAHLESLLNYDYGLILFAGPTGSGKTTTLYTMLTAAKRRYNARIVTLEEPVEKKNESFVQMEVNEKADLTYANGFKAILRHDPDVIMIGEIRDLDTAKIAVRAALTGHLVFSTIHASDSFSTVHRLLEMGIPRYDLKDTLVGVVSQRLIAVHCPVCGRKCTKHCKNRTMNRRTGIYEILAGMALHEVLEKGNRHTKVEYRTLEDYIRIGMAMGYIPRKDHSKLSRHPNAIQ